MSAARLDRTERLVSRLSLAGALLVCGAFLASPAQAQTAWKTLLELVWRYGNEMSAWAVQTKQAALSANVVSGTVRNAKMELASARGAQHTTAQTVRATENFHPQFGGQPASLSCDAVRQNIAAEAALAQRKIDTQALMASYAGARVGDPSQAVQQQWARHRDTYCTVAEAKIKPTPACQLVPNGMQGWDSNYAGAFSETTLSPETELAAYDYAATLIDQRSTLLSACKETACNEQAAISLTSASAASMVANSLIDQATWRRQPELSPSLAQGLNLPIPQ